MRMAKENMVWFNPDKLLEVADKASLNRFTVALGYSRNFIYTSFERKKMQKDALEKICRFYGADPRNIITAEPKNDEVLLELLAEQGDKLNSRIESVEAKHDRDIAELKKVITSLQVQIEQLKNERREA